MASNAHDRSWLPTLTALACLGVFALFLFSLKNATALDDGMRHLSMAREMKEHGLITQGWGRFLYQGYFSVHDSDPWFLADASYIPFTAFDTPLALKLYTLTSIVFLAAMFLLALRKTNITAEQKALLVFLLLLGERAFSARLLLARPYVPMTAILLITHMLLVRRSAVGIGILMTVATLFSHLFVFPGLLIVIGCVILFATDNTRDCLRIAAGCGAGVLAGVALHPHSFEYLHYMFTVFFRIPFMKNIGIGTEFYSGLDKGFFIPLVCSIAVLLGVEAVHTKKIKLENRFGLLQSATVSLLFLPGFLVWERFIDFLWPFVLLFLAETLALKKNVFRQLLKKLTLKDLSTKTIAICTCVFIAYKIFAFEVLVADPAVASDGYRALHNYSAPLSTVPKASKMLNLQWDIIPPLVSVRPDLLYARGMDPTFTFVTDEESMWLFSTPHEQSAVQADPVIDTAKWLTQLLHAYPSDYLIVRPLRIEPFVELLKTDRGLRLTGESDAIAVFEVTPSLKKSAEAYEPIRTDTSRPTNR